MNRRSFAAFLFLLMCGLQGRTQTNDSGVAMQTLDNGVRVLVKPEAETQVVAITAMVKISPARNEQEAAASEIVSRAMVYASGSQSHRTLLKSVEQTGGKWDVLKTPDFISVTAVLPASQLGESLYLLSESFKNAEFSAESLDFARKEILEARRNRDKEAFAALKTVIVRNFAPYVEPDEFYLKRVKPEHAAVYAQTHFVPENLVIALVGKFNVEQAVRAVEMRFGNMKRAGSLKPNSDNPFAGRNPNAALTPKLPAGRAAYALVATAAPAIASPDYPAFVVMQTILGGGHSSRLFQRIREDKGIGYNVGTYFNEERSEPLIAYLQWDGKREFTAKDERLTPLQLLNAQVDSLVTEPPTDAEIQRARNVAIGKHALRHERAHDRAFALAWYETAGLGWQFDTVLPQKLAAVTREEILRVAQIYLPKRVTLIATPK